MYCFQTMRQCFYNYLFLKKTKNQYIVHIYVQQGTLEIAYTLQIERFPYFQPV